MSFPIEIEHPRSKSTRTSYPELENHSEVKKLLDDLDEILIPIRCRGPIAEQFQIELITNIFLCIEFQIPLSGRSHPQEESLG